MIEWLKTILNESYTDDIDKAVSEQIGKEFVSRTDFNTTNETKKQLEAQIKDRDKQLDDLKKVDATGLQAEITRLQGENTKAKTDYDNQLKQTQLDYKLETLLLKEGAVNTKAVKALLDSTKISLDGENLIGVDDQLKSLKEKEKWAFKEQTTEVPGGGGNPAPVLGADKTPLPKGVQIF